MRSDELEARRTIPGWVLLLALGVTFRFRRRPNFPQFDVPVRLGKPRRTAGLSLPPKLGLARPLNILPLEANMHLPDEKNTAEAVRAYTGVRVRIFSEIQEMERREHEKRGVRAPKTTQVKPVPDHATARKCVECQLPAMFFRFASGKKGGVDKSSRQPVCNAHAGK